MTELQPLFDAAWYLAQYDDVARAGVDPWQHYLAHGRFEGRYPCALAPLQLETRLWQATTPEPVIAELTTMLSAAAPLEAALAAWVLARWQGSFARWQQVLPLTKRYLQQPLALQIIGHQGPFLLAFSACYYSDSMQSARALLQDARWPPSVDKALAASMLMSDKEKLQALTAVYQDNGLAGLNCTDNNVRLDSLHSKVSLPFYQRWHQRISAVPLVAIPWLSVPLVSVIVPCYNAATTLPCALRSLLAQSWRNLEILVADDASTDDSAAVVRAFAAQDKRVKLLRLTQNSGAYAARNLALAQAKGHFITCHDADDWSHPEKIARQVHALKQHPEAMASVSHWVRCDARLQFQRWRAEDAWVHRNVSSLLFRRQVRDRLGYWDLVSVNADTEYYYRIKQRFGAHSITEVLPGVPLAFGRVDAQSLSQHSQTHLRTQYSGVRKQYMDAAFAWQQQAGNEGLYLSAAPGQRPFAVPMMICRGEDAARLHNKTLLIQAADAFDASWYLQRYPDIAAAGVDALQHYLLHGETEGRDPSPLFSSSGYRYAANLADGEPALLSAIAAGVNTKQPLQVAGKLPSNSNCNPDKHLMLFSHATSGGQFGAERSFIDVLAALQGTGYRLTVALPGAQSAEYVDTVRQYCHSVLLLPYSWWQYQRPVQCAQVAYLTAFMQQQQVKLVYVNTLVLYEPLLAARAAAVSSVVHVRELLQHDAGLCQVLHATAEQARQHLLESADQFIANSAVVADWLDVPKRCSVIANAVTLAEVAPMPAGERLRVAMLSSNLAKKGLADFIRLAQSAARQQLPLDFYLFGPHSADLEQAVARGELAANVQLCGYVAKPEQALAQVDVVLNLSHFQESFGRTVLEAMQAARAVVAYEWGALPELVLPGCGFLVPYKDINAVEQVLLRLHTDRALLKQTALQASRYARAQFSLQRLGQGLTALFRKHFDEL